MQTVFGNTRRARVHPVATIIAGLFLLITILLWFGPEYSASHQDIFRAAEARDYDRVRSLIEADPRVVLKRDSEGWTPLHRAASPRDNVSEADVKRVVEALLNGADVDAQNNLGQTPLHIASGGFVGRCSPGEAATVELLLAHGANADVKDKEGRVPLQLAAEDACQDLVLTLLSHGANPEVAFLQGGLLHMAAARGLERVGGVLLQRGVDVNTKNREGWTPLHQAVFRKRPEMVQFLISHGANALVKDKLGNTPLDFAQGEGFDNYSGTLEVAPGKSGPCTPGPGGCTYIQLNSYQSHGDASIAALLERHVQKK